jgi:hypothetical protein
MFTSRIRQADFAGRLGRDMALLAVPVIAAVALQLIVLHPKTIDRTDG